MTHGSSTASVIIIDKESGVLRGANLGDSAMAVIRDESFAMKNRDQQYYFNAPYQLSVPLQDGHTTADMANTYEVTLRDKDIIVRAL